jgi:hypothetical protein
MMEEGDSKQLALLITFASSTFVTIALFVLLISSERLAKFTGFIIRLQQLSFALTFAAALLPPSVQAVTPFIAIFNFEIGVIKPGCSIPRIGFLDEFWLTNAFMGSCLVFCIFLSGNRALFIHTYRRYIAAKSARKARSSTNARYSSNLADPVKIKLPHVTVPRMGELEAPDDMAMLGMDKGDLSTAVDSMKLKLPLHRMQSPGLRISMPRLGAQSPLSIQKASASPFLVQKTSSSPARHDSGSGSINGSIVCVKDSPRNGNSPQNSRPGSASRTSQQITPGQVYS